MVNALASGIASSSVGPSHSPAPIEPETPPNEEFPELGFAPPLGPKAQQPKKPTTATAPGPSAAADPSHTRWAAALKRQAPTPLSLVQGDQRFINVHARGAPTRAPPAVARGGAAANVAGGAPSSRPSPRIALRAPTLLPTLVTGSAVENSYTKYRNSALALSEKRNQVSIPAFRIEFRPQLITLMASTDGSIFARFFNSASHAQPKLGKPATAQAPSTGRAKAQPSTRVSSMSPGARHPN